MRDITVPTGIVQDLGNLLVRQLLDVAQPDRLAERFGQRVERRLQFRVELGAQQQRLRALGARRVRASLDRLGRRLDGLGIEIDARPRLIPPAVAPGVMQDREQPGLQVGARR